MTITGSGAISLDDLNAEFGRASATQLSISESFAGTYAQYGDINRNAAPGRTVFTTFTGSSNFALNTFYSYNDVENNYWEYAFDGNSANFDVDVTIVLAGNIIYSNTILSNSSDNSGAYIDTTYSATTGNDLNLRLSTSNYGTVDILITDPDTSATIYTVTGDNMNNYKSTPI